MRAFMPSIDFFSASAEPGGLVTDVPVVWVSSLHPEMKQTPANAIGRIRPPARSEVAFEFIGTSRRDWTWGITAMCERLTASSERLFRSARRPPAAQRRLPGTERNGAERIHARRWMKADAATRPRPHSDANTTPNASQVGAVDFREILNVSDLVCLRACGQPMPRVALRGPRSMSGMCSRWGRPLTRPSGTFSPLPRGEGEGRPRHETGMDARGCPHQLFIPPASPCGPRKGCSHLVETLAKTLQDRLHRAEPGPIGRLIRIVALVE